MKFFRIYLIIYSFCFLYSQNKLLDKINENDENGVEGLLSEGLDVNSKDDQGRTPLFRAAENGWDIVVELLLLKGADPNIKGSEGKTALHIAVENRNIKIITTLASKGADVFVKNNKDVSPLEYALMNQYSDEAIAMVNINNLDVVDDKGNTLLHYAAFYKDLKLLNFLLQKNASVFAINFAGERPLDSDLKTGITSAKGKIAKALIDKGSPLPLDKQYEYIYVPLKTGQTIVHFQDGITALHQAIKSGHIGLALYFIEEGIDINVKDSQGYTPLLYAISYGYVPIIKFLVENYKIDINTIDNKGNNGLHVAINNSGNIKNIKETLNFLIEKGIDVNKVNNTGATPIHRAIEINNIEIADILSSAKNINLEAQNNIGKTPLNLAVYLGAKDMVSLLVKKGASIFTKDISGVNPALYSIRKGADNVSWLFEKDDTNYLYDENNENIIYYAVKENNSEVFNYLVTKKFDINHQNNLGESLLHHTIKIKNLEMTLALIQKGADIFMLDNNGFAPISSSFYTNDDFLNGFLTRDVLSKKDRLGRSPLFYTIYQNKADVAIQMLTRNQNLVNIYTNDGNTPLHEAVKYRNLEITRILIDNKANTSQKNNAGDTVLHEAVRYGSQAIVTLLLSAGADINAQNNLGNTPLHNVSLWTGNNFRVIDVLLNFGANIEAKNFNSRTPFLETIFKNKDEAALYLKLKGCNINAVDDQGQNALFYSVKNNNYNISEFLLTNNINVNVRDTSGNTVLHNNYNVISQKLIDLLVKNKIDVFARNYRNESILDDAIRQSLEIVKKIINENNINSQNDSGETPLHRVLRLKGAVNITQYMINIGSNLYLRDNKGVSCLDIIKNNNVPVKYNEK